MNLDSALGPSVHPERLLLSSRIRDYVAAVAVIAAAACLISAATGAGRDT